GGYCSQGAVPAHFGIPDASGVVDVQVTAIRRGERVLVTVAGVDVSTQASGHLVVEVP
ncbi:MAG: hypothetical protein HKN73_07700, partial [Gemmatimonadetes bacterium]|nr:hypothetical protein [Gemmatimonadota bacterium]